VGGAPGGGADTGRDAAAERARELVTRVAGTNLAGEPGLAVSRVELGAELRLRLANGLTLSINPAGAGPALVRGAAFDAGYAGELPEGVELEQARRVMTALLAGLDGLAPGEREVLLGTLARRQ
jgi:hypothetical protein